LGAALVEQESGGKNIFGCDRGSIHCHLPVNRVAVRELLEYVDAGGTSNGVGLTQITYPPLIRDAQALGGAHLMRNQLIVGFGLLAEFLAHYPYRSALEGYNTGRPWANDPLNDYDVRLVERRRAWTQRLKEPRS
jgi:hypothetical protein